MISNLDMHRLVIKILSLVTLAIALSKVQSRPLKVTDIRDRMHGPDILESRMSIIEGAALIKMTKDMLDPISKDINKTLLMKKLGRNFDPTFMSVMRPNKARRLHGAGLSVRKSPVQRQAQAMPWRIQQLQFEIKKKGEKGRRRVLGHRASKKLRQWLWELSRCPINYTWVDYGVKVFPRYIKYGRCEDKPCSFPAGLTCRPRGTRTLRLLIWVCPPNAINSCSWHPFSLNVLTSCKCACKDRLYS